MDAAADSERVVLIAMDGSKKADYALECYLNHIHRNDDKAILLYVPEYQTLVKSPIFTADPASVYDLLGEEETQIREYMESLGKQLQDKEVKGIVKIVGGKPGETIVRVATEENATLIVVGTRGMGRIRRTLMGSISDYVVHHSLIPVMVCRSDDPSKRRCLSE